jgi:hypothetical protein
LFVEVKYLLEHEVKLLGYSPAPDNLIVIGHRVRLPDKYFLVKIFQALLYLDRSEGLLSW